MFGSSGSAWGAALGASACGVCAAGCSGTTGNCCCSGRSDRTGGCPDTGAWLFCSLGLRSVGSVGFETGAAAPAGAAGLKTSVAPARRSGGSFAASSAANISSARRRDSAACCWIFSNSAAVCSAPSARALSATSRTTSSRLSRLSLAISSAEFTAPNPPPRNPSPTTCFQFTSAPLSVPADAPSCSINPWIPSVEASPPMSTSAF